VQSAGNAIIVGDEANIRRLDPLGQAGRIGRSTGELWPIGEFAG
jgi:hypothetical protein